MSAPSNPPSGTSTPRGFTNQTASAEDILKSHTVGLVNLSDFRKRRADVLEQKEKEAREGILGARPTEVEENDGTLTPKSENPPKKKKRKTAKGLLSFGDDDDDSDVKSSSSTPNIKSSTNSLHSVPEPAAVVNALHRKLNPNPNTTLPVPKAMTKAALAAEATERDRLRKEFLELQDKVKNTEIGIPFVFYDGSNTPGGTVKVKKGDHIWLFLERCRKLGAELGVSGSSAGRGGNMKSRDDSRKQWARVGVDDLMCVRGGVIVPHHYEFYYFIANKIPDPSQEGRLLFEYEGTVMQKHNTEEAPLLRTPGNEHLEGQTDDPTRTKVVDRRWYERNKHIYPASLWKEFKTGKEFEDLAKAKRDAQGNAFFFS